jgi:RNA polymerase sigma-70 factor (ECF subfamily)
MPDSSDQWRTWLDQHGPALVLLARQWVASRADAEDVVQEAFVRFWRSRGQVSEPLAYLYGCLKHCALDWQRAGKRRFRREEATARPEAETLFTGRLDADERRAAVETALQTLPEKQREALVMKIWGGLTFRQIAAALAISADTAASRYRYALAKLHEELAEEPIL